MNLDATLSPAAGSKGRWKVLLVDDEPAVHDVSRLILDDLVFEGRGLELLSAGSAAQARELLAEHRDIALLLLDVVMETDDAGLALVEHIRTRLGNADMQIVLRTGQPGMAPPDEVVLRCEVNGYCLKTELSAQQLHSIVVSALRSYRHTCALRALLARAAPAPAAEPEAADPVAALANAGAAQRSALALELDSTPTVDTLLLHAQPEIVLATHAVYGIELVPQWKTSRGLLSAAQVVDAVPDGAARGQLVRGLLAQACSWARSWQAAGGRALSVSVPLVAESLGHAETMVAVAELVHQAALPPGTLDLLVGDATLLGGGAQVGRAVAALRTLGVRFTLVDFGARTISLPRLHRLLPDRLKLHRLFVRGVADDAEQMALARSVIALAQTLAITTVADGVSTSRDVQFFKWEGCDIGQGDALAPACALAEVAGYLEHGRTSRH